MDEREAVGIQEFSVSPPTPSPPLAWSCPWAGTLSGRGSLSGKEWGDKHPHTLSALLLHVKNHFVLFDYVGACVCVCECWCPNWVSWKSDMLELGPLDEQYVLLTTEHLSSASLDTSDRVL